MRVVFRSYPSAIRRAPPTPMVRRSEPSEPPDYTARVVDHALKRARYQELWQSGHLRGALALSTYVLGLAKDLYGPHHTEYATELCNHGGILQDFGKTQEALPFLRAAIYVLERTSGPQSGEYLVCSHNLAQVLHQLSQHDEAEDLAASNLATWRQVATPNPTSIGRTLDLLGLIAQARGIFKGARNFYEQALEHKEKVFGKDDLECARTLKIFADLELEDGNLERMETYLLRSLAIKKKSLGPHHPETLWMTIALGKMHIERGNFDRAKTTFNDCLIDCQKYIGSEHPIAATCNGHLGVIELAKQQFGMARVFLLEAVRMWEHLMGKSALQLGMPLVYLAAASKDKGEPHTAQAYLERALVIFQKVLGERHPQTAMAYEKLGLLHLENHNFDQAVHLLETAMQSLAAVYGSLPPIFAQTQMNLARAYFAVGNRDAFTATSYGLVDLALAERRAGRKPELFLQAFDAIVEGLWTINQAPLAERLIGKRKGAGFTD